VAFPTRYEGFGYVTVEGLACGVPVLTTAAGWTEEFLRECPEYRAFIVEPDVDSIAQGLTRLAGSDATSVLARARAFIGRHNSLGVFSRRWLELIGEVCPR
jgi:glycosyltransferase involved in cell wall biosynthesis